MKAVIDNLKKGEKRMNQMIIKFQNPEEVLDFVNKVAKYPYDMDMKRGRFVVDAKSILGIMNLGFNHPQFRCYAVFRFCKQDLQCPAVSFQTFQPALFDGYGQWLLKYSHCFH